MVIFHSYVKLPEGTLCSVSLPELSSKLAEHLNQSMMKFGNHSELAQEAIVQTRPCLSYVQDGAQ